MRILLVEDERKLAASVKKGVEQSSGWVVDTVEDGEEGLLYARTHEYDAIILDLMLPRKGGLDVLRELRADGSRCPVFLLTARESIESKVQGLELGADDYLTKPFDLRELVARIRAFKYTAERGVIRVDLRSTSSGVCELTVADTGIGFQRKRSRAYLIASTALIKSVRGNAEVVGLD